MSRGRCFFFLASWLSRFLTVTDITAKGLILEKIIFLLQIAMSATNELIDTDVSFLNTCWYNLIKGMQQNSMSESATSGNMQQCITLLRNIANKSIIGHTHDFSHLAILGMGPRMPMVRQNIVTHFIRVGYAISCSCKKYLHGISCKNYKHGTWY